MYKDGRRSKLDNNIEITNILTQIFNKYFVVITKNVIYAK